MTFPCDQCGTFPCTCPSCAKTPVEQSLDERFGAARDCRRCQERFRSLDPREAYCAGCRKRG